MVPGWLLLGDGEIELRVQKQEGANFLAKVVIGGQLKSRKGITLLGKVFDVPAITDPDRDDEVEADKSGPDYIAQSNLKCSNDVRDLRRIVDSLNPGIALCAKIENAAKVFKISTISSRLMDVVMVARGDMGLQMDIEDVPLMQKKIIHACSKVGKPVITATQMLESMTLNPRPTRAEATDVANAILDGTDAIMLSAETASGPAIPSNV